MQNSKPVVERSYPQARFAGNATAKPSSSEPSHGPLPGSIQLLKLFI